MASALPVVKDTRGLGKGSGGERGRQAGRGVHGRCGAGERQNEISVVTAREK